MKRLQKFAIDRPIAVSMFYLGLVVLGLVSFSRLEVNLLPRMEFPRLTVVTLYPNASPTEVEKLVTAPVSEAIGSVNGIDRISSESLEGVSIITLQFTWGVKTDFAALEVREKADLVRSLLPQEAGKPVVVKFDPAQAPVMELVFFAKNMAKPKDLRWFLEKDVKGYLERVDGTALVQFSGGYKKEVLIEADQERLAAYNLSLNKIKDSVSAANLNYPAGRVTSGNRDILIRTLGEFRNSRDISRTVVGRNKDGVPVRLSEVAGVKNSYRERTGLARYNGNECVVLSIYKEAGQNTVALSDRLKKEVEGIRGRFSRELDVRIIYDESRFVRQSVNNITQSLVVGAILAFMALFLILRNLRSPAILLTALPISLLTTCGFMYFQGISLNIMSLGGLALGVGMLFDSGNVVLAAVERHLNAGLSPKEAALRGATEVSGSITVALTTTIIVFLPIVFLEGVVGVVFAEMALTITFSLIVSLAVSLTLIPMMTSLQPEKLRTDGSHKSKILQKAALAQEKLDGHYEKGLVYFLNRPRRLFLILGLLFVGAIICLPFIQREFVPRVDTGEFNVELENFRGSSLDNTALTAEWIEETLKKEKGVIHVVSRVGYGEEQLLTRRGGDFGLHQAKIRVVLSPDRSAATGETIAMLREKIKLRDDLKVSFKAGGDILGKILNPDSSPITLEITGEDLKLLKKTGREVQLAIQKIPGVVDVKAGLEDRKREFHVKFDEEIMASLNLSNDYLAHYLKTAVKGDIISRLRTDDNEIEIRLRLKKSDASFPTRLMNMVVPNEEGKQVFLSQVSRLNKDFGYTSIERRGPSRVNRITADISGVGPNRVFADLDAYIKNLKLPEGITVGFSGHQADISKSFRELGYSFLLAVALIYMVLAAKFESLIYPLVMLCAIPLILIGIFPALLFTGKSINVSSFMGAILLVGIVVDNAALFYEYVEILREEGRVLEESIREAGKIILRPVMMNNSTTMLGLLPVALELGEGTEFQSPMAVAVISGLAAAVLLSLFVMPVVFYLILKRKERRQGA